MSHGRKKDGFQFTIQRAQLKLQGWYGVKVADQVAIWNELISDFDSVIRDFNVQKISMEKGIVHTFVTPNSQWRNPAESSMKKVQEGALAMLRHAGYPDDLRERCVEQTAFTYSLAWVRRHELEEHKNVVPWTRLTGERMGIETLHVMGSAAWGYIRREDRDVQKSYQHIGHYGGYDVELKSHVIVDTDGALVRVPFVATDHKVLYRDRMGAAYQLRLRTTGQSLEMEERQHRQIMDVVQAREDLLAQTKGPIDVAMSLTPSQLSDMAAASLPHGRALAENSAELLRQYGDIDRGQAASGSEAAEQEDVPRRSSGRESRKPKGGTSWKDPGWDPVNGSFGGDIGVVISKWRQSELEKLSSRSAHTQMFPDFSEGSGEFQIAVCG
jgi:hypothetical protein